MQQYDRETMRITKIESARSQAQLDVMNELTQYDARADEYKGYACGPFTVYLDAMPSFGYGNGKDYRMDQLWLNLFCEDECIGEMTVNVATALEHLTPEGFENLEVMLPYGMFELETVRRLLAKYLHSARDERDCVLYILNMYVQEEYRGLGMARLLMDVLRTATGDQAICWNLGQDSGDAPALAEELGIKDVQGSKKYIKWAYYMPEN